MDNIPDNKTQKVYDKELTFKCDYFKNINGNIYVNLENNILTTTCKTSNDTEFHLFTYYSNISSATVTVKNNNKAISYLTLKDEKLIVILSVNPDFITYVNCNLSNCNYKSINQNEAISNNEQIYSACSGSNNCLSQLNFTKEFGSFTFNNTKYFGNIMKMSKLMWPWQPNPVLNCRNGGTINQTNNKCDCPKNENFIESGPECESLQISLTSTKYLYVLPNSDGLKIEFSLFIPSLQGIKDIVTIIRNKNEFLKYSIKEINHTLNITGSILSLNYPVDFPPKWINVFINIFNDKNQRKIVFQANDINTFKTESNSSFDLNFDGVPLIFLKTDTKSCLANLFVNNRMIDLYLPEYENCKPNCGTCKSNEKCISQPFQSTATQKCFCQAGMKQTANGCESDTNSTINIKNEEIISVNIIKSNNLFDRIQYKFRTYSQFVTLSLINFKDPKNCISTLSVYNSNLQVNIQNSIFSLSNSLTYNVSDGEWHSIIFKMNYYIMEVILDENIQYNIKIRFDKAFFDSKFEEFKVINITLGPFNQSIYNKYVSCSSVEAFSLVSLTNYALNEYVTADSANMSNTCDLYTCGKIKCSENENCTNKWQNPICSCINGFIKVKEKCVYIKCQPDPCKNGRNCFYNADINDYQCDCGQDYEGRNCEISISKAEFLWWIILLVLLILLIIIIAILIWFCYCKKRREMQNTPDINKIHENTVCYNEQAGEADYMGPPINFSLINNPSQMKPYKVPLYPSNEFREMKQKIEANNDDLIIDHPLEYGFEGANSEIGSISSLGSKSTDEELDVHPIKSNINNNNKFTNLNNIYK